MKLYLIFVILLSILPTIYACHNATGTCIEKGFVCANEEIVSHSQRCDGIEDCSDGTDEYMCDYLSTYKPSFTERLANIETSCIKCTCFKGTITIQNTNTLWFKIAITSPRDLTMMTNAPTYQNKPCHPTQTTSIILNVYKKNNKGCRGFVCCFRQENCASCSSGTPSTHCY